MQALTLRNGDIIVRLGDEPVRDLGNFSKVLKASTAGDSLAIVFLREGTEMTVETVLVER